jgi:uncharacterized protein (TIGR03066 family)
MNSKVKPKKLQRAHTPPRPAQQPGQTVSPRRWLVLALLALAAAAGTWALFELVVWNTVPPELVGKWVVVDGPQEGATFDFYRGGTMVGRVNAGGNEAIVEARIEVDGKKIHSTTRHPQTGQSDTKVLTIRTLTTRQLVVVGPDGDALRMERAD